MPVLRSIRERLALEQPLAGLRVGACLHVTAETGCLVRALVAGGAEVALAAANPLTTQDEVVAALAADGCAAYGRRGEDADAYAAGVIAVVDGAPQVTLDDGADLLTVLHAARPEQLPGLVGGTEETTTGLLRLRALEAEGRLACPVIAVNEARTERLFNDHYGTGQSTLDGILRATNLLLAGKTIVVLGYGWTGRGVALRARGAGAQVIVCEIDPMRALEARMEGFEVMPALVAAERGDIFVTVTGSRDVLTTPHFAVMKDGAVLANAGHFDVEIDLAALAADRRRAAARRAPARHPVRARRPPAEPARVGARGQPRRRPGPSRRGHGHVVREPGARRRAPRRRLARSGRPSRARGARPRDRAAQARVARRRDRHAHRRAGGLPARLAARRIAAVSDEGLAAAVEKMRRDEVPDAAIATFEHYFRPARGR